MDRSLQKLVESVVADSKRAKEDEALNEVDYYGKGAKKPNGGYEQHLKNIHKARTSGPVEYSDYHKGENERKAKYHANEVMHHARDNGHGNDLTSAIHNKHYDKHISGLRVNKKPNERGARTHNMAVGNHNHKVRSHFAEHLVKHLNSEGRANIK